jgi:hypothetical protein
MDSSGSGYGQFADSCGHDNEFSNSVEGRKVFDH